MVYTHCSRVWPASIVYVEMVVGSRIDSTFASLPRMVRSNGAYGNESIKTKICSRTLSFVCRRAFQGLRGSKAGFHQNEREKENGKNCEIFIHSAIIETRICWFQSYSRDVSVQYCCGS